MTRILLDILKGVCNGMAGLPALGNGIQAEQESCDLKLILQTVYFAKDRADILFG